MCVQQARHGIRFQTHDFNYAAIKLKCQSDCALAITAATMGAAKLPPPKSYVQDMPPPGGYAKPASFPAEAFRRRSPSRAPAGIILAGGVLSMMAYSLWRLLGDVEERK